MDLRSESPFWLLKNGFVHSYPSLKQDIRTEVAILGAGITGALVGHCLSQAGIEVTLLDRRHVGTGSTCASTALLQYEIDTPLRELIPLVGETHAVRSYRLCLESIEKLEALASHVGEGKNFRMRKSFYYASARKDVSALRQEYELRKQHGIALSWLESGEIREKFGFDAPAGLLSAQGAETDAYRLMHAVLQDILKMGGNVYDRTTVNDIAYGHNRVTLTTADGCTIHAKRLVIAAGYESQRYLKQQVEILNSTFATVSEPLAQSQLWYENCLIWETARPYLYMRTIADNRILVGGKDVPFYNPERRDKMIPKKSQQLKKAFESKFPHLSFSIDYQWAGTFTGTSDGLPYIGESAERPLTYFALGFGGNGITFSQIAAEIIRDLYLGKKTPDAAIFAFDRGK
jgi:glycine/D-amino acid oxidase-like deaminating enzyme